MTGVFARNMQAAAFHIILNRRRNITGAIADAHLINRRNQRAFCDFHQALRLRGNLPHRKRHCRVSDKTFEHRSAIHGDDVTFAENPLLARDSMHQFFIDAATNRSRIRRLAVAFERRITTVFLQHFLSSRVEIGR